MAEFNESLRVVGAQLVFCEPSVADHGEWTSEQLAAIGSVTVEVRENDKCDCAGLHVRPLGGQPVLYAPQLPECKQQLGALCTIAALGKPHVTQRGHFFRCPADRVAPETSFSTTIRYAGKTVSRGRGRGRGREQGV